jgi:hypothetical protein
VEPVKGVVIQRGWDFGLTPACVFTQIHPDGRWLVFDELTADDSRHRHVRRYGRSALRAEVFGFEFEDYGDPAGSQRSAMTADRDEKTCFDILRGKGIAISRASRT